MAMFHTEVLDNQIKALSTIDTASGSIATFTTDKAERLVECNVEISASASKVYLANMSDITNKAFFDGLLNGTYGFVDLGSLNWNYANGGFNVAGPSGIKSGLCNMACTALTPYPDNFSWSVFPSLPNDIIAKNSGNTDLYAKATEYTSASDFKTYLSGKYLIYELATPTTPTITKSEFETLLTDFGLSGWLFEYDLGETVSSNASLDCVSGILTRSDDTTKHVDGNVITALIDENNIWSDTGDIIDLKFVLSVGQAIS